MCHYCATPFLVCHTSDRQHCSELCGKRLTAWNRWHRPLPYDKERPRTYNERVQHTLKPFPPAGPTMAESISRFASLDA